MVRLANIFIFSSLLPFVSSAETEVTASDKRAEAAPQREEAVSKSVIEQAVNQVLARSEARQAANHLAQMPMRTPAAPQGPAPTMVQQPAAPTFSDGYTPLVANTELGKAMGRELGKQLGLALGRAQLGPRQEAFQGYPYGYPYNGMGYPYQMSAPSAYGYGYGMGYGYGYPYSYASPYYAGYYPQYTYNGYPGYGYTFA